jgi:hypothetical protein
MISNLTVDLVYSHHKYGNKGGKEEGREGNETESGKTEPFALGLL